MKNPSQFIRAPFIRWTGLLGLSLVLLFSGCATRNQAIKVDEQSNAAMISSQLGELPQKDGERSAPTFTDSNRQIEAFIAAHPGQNEMTAPLRIRQALLLLANKQSNLAKAAFDSVAEADLHTDRDRALKHNSDHLIWWFSQSANDTWTANDQTKAVSAVKALAQAQDSLGNSPEIRDYLAEMRAWIGLASAKQTTSLAEARKRLEDALNVYARIFSAHDFELLKEGNEPSSGASLSSPDVRRRLRAHAVLTHAQKQNESDSLGAHPQNPTFDAIVNRAH